MKKPVRFLSLFLSLCLVVQILPVTVQAKSETYWETVKDGVPLRYAMGSGYDVQSRISKKSVVVKEIQRDINWVFLKPNTWYKVRVAEGYTNNGLSGDFWVYGGNLTKHKHKISAGRCTSSGCDYVESITKIDDKTYYLEVTIEDAAVREVPYSDGNKPVQHLKKGRSITAVQKVKTYKNTTWYKLKSGNYIYSGNVKIATTQKIDADNRSIINSKDDGYIGSAPSLPKPDASEFITYEPSPCIKHTWSSGACMICKQEWPLLVTPVNGTFKTNIENAKAKDIPYSTGKVMKTYPEKGTLVTITGVHKNSAGKTWYRTEDGYWTYRVGEVSMTGASFTSSGYTFSDINTTWTPTLVVQPSEAEIVSKTWHSSNGNVATVSDSGVVTPTGKPGKSTISCTVKSVEGATAYARAEVVVPETINLDTWRYDSETFEYDLALECSEYMCLAYPGYDYTYHNGDLIVFQTDQSPKTPNNLIRLLQNRGMDYQVSQNYYKKTRYNSPYVLASKTVNHNGEVTPVVYVIIEGSAGLAGWEGNMMVSGTSYSNQTEHETFEASAEDILQGLHAYIKQFAKKPLVVVTGHSRGAAVGNLLAEKLNHDNTVREVYAYTFATPNATKDPQPAKNIFNICNRDDFVPYIPFSNKGWEFEKHGTTYTFSSKNLYSTDVSFRFYAKTQFERSSGVGLYIFERENLDYNYQYGTPKSIKKYAVGKWKTLQEYYHHTTPYECDLEAYEYFMQGLAKAAGNPSISNAGLILKHMHWDLMDDKSDPNIDCVFHPLSLFFGFNGFASVTGTAAFNDSHQAFTYHAAMLSKTYGSDGSAYLYSVNEYGNDSVDLDEAEREAMAAFFTQSENRLMLELEGWNVEDPTTWTGVLWNTEGHIVSMDLSYLGLSGWLDVSTLNKLENLDIDGNDISLLALGENNSMTHLSCSYNDLSSLDVQNCGNLQNLSCSYNQLETLDVSNLSSLQQLNCYGNALTSLNLSGATALSTLDCSGNQLYNIDLSTNTSLSTFFCSNNLIIESQNLALSSAVSSINEAGGTAFIGAQQYMEGYDFNAEEVQNLTEFANSALNLEKLGWDLSDPWSWAGIQWKIYGDEYHIAAVNLDNLDLEGDLNLPDAAYLESLSCANSALSTLNLSGCTTVSAVDCYNSGISTLELNGCTSLSAINCNENYLEIEDVESSFSQIGLQTGLATYENQNIGADEESFDAHEREELIALLSTGDNAEILGWDWNWPGTWDGIVWTRDEEGTYRVNKINFAQLDVVGTLDLTGFDYLEDFNFSGTALEAVTLPDCITGIPAYAFYKSAVETVYLSDGITAVKEQAFAYCSSLKTVTLPASVTKIEDAAFFGCTKLANLVFAGDAPLSVGSQVFSNTAPTFRITIFEDTDWSGGTGLLDSYQYQVSSTPYTLLMDNDLALITDDSYGPTNIYPGDDIRVTIATPTPDEDVVCLLVVYNENGALDNVSVEKVSLEQYQTDLFFQDVNIQYVGEEFCQIKVFLCAADGSLVPLAQCTNTLLFKPLES